MFDGLPEPVREVLTHLTARPDTPSLDALCMQVRQHRARFHEAARTNGLLPIDIADELAKGFERLFSLYSELDDRERVLVVAAVRYFISDEDVRPDLESVLGLDDDLAVFNWVVEELGSSNLKIDL